MSLKSWVLNEFESRGLFVEREDLKVNIFGIRNSKARVNHFDDFIGVFSKSWDGWNFRVWRGSTRPGLPSLLKPVNEKGTAILVPGQYKDAYSLGLYKGKKALRQTGLVRVFRDADKDSSWDTNPDSIESGSFGLHIHRAGWWSQLVGPYSAGCQVLQKSTDFDSLIEFVEIAKDVGQELFTYTLFEK